MALSLSFMNSLFHLGSLCITCNIEKYRGQGMTRSLRGGGGGGGRGEGMCPFCPPWIRAWQPFPDPKRKRKPTNLNKHKPNKHTKSTKISSLFPKRGNRNTKRTGKHKNKMTHGKTYNKSPRRINHKATKSKTPGPPP